MISFLAIFCLWPLGDPLPPRSLAEWMARLDATPDPARVTTVMLEATARLVDPEARVFENDGEKEEAEGHRQGLVEEWRDFGEGLVYLKPASFDEALGGLVASALTWSAQTGGAGVILDGRGGDGTILEGVEAVMGRFVEPDVFLYGIQNMGGVDLDYRSAPHEEPASVPLVYLVDERTRGTAELLAALLVEKGRALVMGQPTSGDGVIRRTLPLSDGRYVRMAVAVLVHPDGRSWRGRGVDPHIRVVGEEWKRPEFRVEDVAKKGKPLNEEVRRHVELFIQTRRDAALARAVDILLALKSLSGVSNGPP